MATSFQVPGRLRVGLLAAALAFVAAGPPGVAWAASQEPVAGGLTLAAAVPGGEAEDAVALPRILSEKDATLYARIFALQEDGRWDEADRLIAALGDRTLMGYVLAQRYLHPTKYKSSYEELAGWLAHYSDLPNAQRIHRLALRRQPKGAAAPQEPSPGSFGVEVEDASAPIDAYEDAGLPKAQQKRLAKLLGQLRELVSDGEVRAAYDILRSPEFDSLADDATFDKAAQLVAFLYFLKGKDEQALKIAAVSARRSGDTVPLTHWTAGLAAYRLGKLDTAFKHFAALARADAATTRQQAAGAFWAARTAMLTGKSGEVFRNLALAAGHPTTFYGLLARESLGQPLDFAWDTPTLSPRERDELLRYPEVRRALALVEAGQRRMAELEFNGLKPGNDPGRALLVLSLASRLGLAATEIRMAYGLADKWDTRYQGSLYPVPAYRPTGGFTVDRALIYALMRQESAFNPFARSSAGAAGLMQLMPATAAFISGNGALDDKGNTSLFEPGLNVDLGQRYIQHLMAEPDIGDNLFMVVAAYNGGPGNLRKWTAGMKRTDDPLLFIESVPSSETRHFIQQVMANLWLYRARLGQDSPSLAAVATGGWPAYEGQDVRVLTASNAGD